MASADLWDVNPHLALAASESFESTSDRAWDMFVRHVEKLIGHDLDGDQDRNGYSIDFAHDCFCDGMTAAECALEVADEKARRAPAPRPFYGAECPPIANKSPLS